MTDLAAARSAAEQTFGIATEDYGFSDGSSVIVVPVLDDVSYDDTVIIVGPEGEPGRELDDPKFDAWPEVGETKGA